MSYVEICIVQGGAQRAPAADYERILAAVESGAAFVSFTDIHGAEYLTRCSQIESVAFWTEEALAAYRERKASASMTGDAP